MPPGIAFAGTILVYLTFFSFAATGVIIALRVPAARSRRS